MNIQPARIMGHRGAPGLAPENTLGGFATAARNGAAWVELDVTLLQDLTPVVHHDATLERCSDASGELALLQPEDLAGVDCAALYPDWPAEPVPLLADVLALLQQLDLGLNLEIKHHSHSAAVSVKAIIDALTDFPRDKLLISSFDTGVLAECQRYAAQIPRGLICDGLPDNWEDLAKELNLFSIHANWRKLNQSQVVSIKQHNYRLYYWTVNHPADAASFWHWGIDGVITDNPQDFINQDFSPNHETE